MIEPKDEIKEKLDVAEVLGDYIQLKPAGTGSLKALCPFHTERTPSFHVSRERQSWHCFGCDKGGDIFSFVMEMDGLTFPEALRQLAKKAGVELPAYKSTPHDNTRERLLLMHDAAASFYTSTLWSSEYGKSVKTYIENRGIDEALAMKFRLGASPDAWDVLVNHLSKRGFAEQEMIEGGLAMKRKNGSGCVDRFRNRLMIPLCDAGGGVIAFTARQLPGAGEADGPKYMNSPETPIYKKGEMLYGLHLAKAGMREKKCVIVVEGNLDVIASHKAGVENIVASSGTALTALQLRTLARYTKQIVFALDEDAAGFAAAKRVLDLALELQKDPGAPQFEIRCLIIPDGAGKDPDEIVQKDPELWRRIVAHSEDVIEYVFTKRLRLFEDGAGAAKIEARKSLVDELLPYVAKLTRPDSRHLYLLRISDATHVDMDSLMQMLQFKVHASLPTKSQTAPSKGKDPIVSVAKPVRIPDTSETKYERSLGFLLGISVKYEGFVTEILATVREELLTGSTWEPLYIGLRALYNRPEQLPNTLAPQEPLFLRLLSWLSANGHTRETSVFNALVIQTDELLDGLSPKEVRQEADRNLLIVSQELALRARAALERDIREAELSGDDTRLHSLMRAYRDMVSQK
ncbi:MAG: DNA primase [Patescibacteria group bacterium]|jgi:DNA primase